MCLHWREPPPRTYAEIPTSDPLRVTWVDKAGGKLLFSGEKWVCADGKKLSFTVDTKKQGKAVQFLYVFDRTGPWRLGAAVATVAAGVAIRAMRRLACLAK